MRVVIPIFGSNSKPLYTLEGVTQQSGAKVRLSKFELGRRITILGVLGVFLDLLGSIRNGRL